MDPKHISIMDSGIVAFIRMRTRRLLSTYYNKPTPQHTDNEPTPQHTDDEPNPQSTDNGPTFQMNGFTFTRLPKDENGDFIKWVDDSLFTSISNEPAGQFPWTWHQKCLFTEGHGVWGLSSEISKYLEIYPNAGDDY